VYVDIWHWYTLYWSAVGFIPCNIAVPPPVGSIRWCIKPRHRYPRAAYKIATREAASFNAFEHLEVTIAESMTLASPKDIHAVGLSFYCIISFFDRTIVSLMKLPCY